MRDPRRIKKVLKEIEESWLDFPDWRFGQWFSNIIEDQVGDPFFLEDDELVDIIKKYNSNKKRRCHRL
jgi:hypothetical protein